MSAESQPTSGQRNKIIDLDARWPDELQEHLAKGHDLDFVDWLGTSLDFVKEIDSWPRKFIDREIWKRAVDQLCKKLVIVNDTLEKTEPPTGYRVGLALPDPQQDDEFEIVHKTALEDRFDMYTRFPPSLSGLVAVLYVEEKPDPESH